MERERICETGGTRSPVIIMSDEYGGHGGEMWVGVGGAGAGSRLGGVDADQSSCFPRLLVPGMTPRSSTSSQSCLSVPGTTDVNGYVIQQRRQFRY